MKLQIEKEKSVTVWNIYYAQGKTADVQKVTFPVTTQTIFQRTVIIKFHSLSILKSAT